MKLEDLQATIVMDYLDELDEFAMQALAELGEGVDFQASPITTISTVGGSSQIPSPSMHRRRRRIDTTYLLRLDHPLSEAWEIAAILQLPRVPQIELGIGESGESLARFCHLSQTNIHALGIWVAKNHPRKQLTKVRLGIAHKDPYQLPMLGLDPTLPHYRPSMSTTGTEKTTTEGEWPVYYFFYGTLVSSSRLSRLFDISSSELHRLREATLLDGQIRTWAGKYAALIDCPGGKAQGFVYQVESADQEDALRVYEGDDYEVVRANIVLEGRVIEGRTFRFSGIEDELGE